MLPSAGTVIQAAVLRTNTDSLQGDSGSSLMCRQTDSLGDYYKLFGIVSSGFGCGNKGQPGYYTYVPFYINWIETTIESLTTLAEG